MKWDLIALACGTLAHLAPCQATGEPEAESPEALVDAIEGGIDADPAAARRGAEAFLARFPETEPAARVRANLLPTAWLLSVGVDGLREYLDAAEPSIAPEERPFLQVWRGDCAAFSGDYASAERLYAEALAALQRYGATTPPRRRLRAETELRIGLVGKEAPDVDGVEWLGREPTTLKESSAHLVVLDFWATWCPPCRIAMPRLDALYREHRSRGLDIWGVTMPFATGYLPANPDQLLSGGETVNDMDEAAFVEHLAAFRQGSGITYPFLLASQSEHDRYLVENRPTIVVVDEERRVRLASFGYEAERLVRALVRERLGDGN